MHLRVDDQRKDVVRVMHHLKELELWAHIGWGEWRLP